MKKSKIKVAPGVAKLIRENNKTNTPTSLHINTKTGTIFATTGKHTGEDVTGYNLWLFTHIPEKNASVTWTGTKIKKLAECHCENHNIKLF